MTDLTATVAGLPAHLRLAALAALLLFAAGLTATIVAIITWTRRPTPVRPARPRPAARPGRTDSHTANVTRPLAATAGRANTTDQRPWPAGSAPMRIEYRTGRAVAARPDPTLVMPAVGDHWTGGAA